MPTVQMYEWNYETLSLHDVITLAETCLIICIADFYLIE